MDRKGWPWRKKSSDKIVSTADNLDSSPTYSSKQSEEQGSPKFYGKQMQTSGEMTQLLQEEAKVKNLKEQLSTALLDVTAKDNLVKQHAKVADEAVTGWEKAEAEAVTLKEKLDVTLRQKLATEDRVAHLDGALKECMRQLRHVREEQEQQIHDVVVKKTREWEKVRLEMEAKLADVGHQLLEAETENSAMSKTLQEHARSILEASKAKSHDDAKIQELQICLESVEMKNTKLKYEVHVLTKELEIRNEEREYNKKAADVASKQHLENVKKIAKLEAECQRLRLLVRKRLPGPAALAQMKLEVEALGKETGERLRRRAPSHRYVSPVPSETAKDTLQEDVSKEAEILSSRLLIMAEEIKLLKEVIAKRNSELQTARLMCARTASKLSSVEEQLVNLSGTHGLPKTPCLPLEGQIELPVASIASIEPSLASMSEYGGTEDEVSCAESWASALIAELAQFKKEKGGAVTDKTLESSNFDLMDDFAEIEKLASLTSENNSSISGEGEKILEIVCRTDGNNQEENRSENMEHSGILTNQEEESGNRQCEELEIKLAHAEEQVDVLRARQATIEARLASFQQRLITILDGEVEETSAIKVVGEVKKAIEAFKAFETQQSTDLAITSCRSYLETLSHESRSAQTWSPRSHSGENHSDDDAVASSAAKSKVCSIVPELAAAVRKVLGLAEGLAELDLSFALPNAMPVQDSGSNLAQETVEGQEHTDMRKQLGSLEFDACIQSLVVLCNGLLHGKVDIIDFIAEVASTLDWLMDHIILGPEKTPVRMSKRKRLSWGKGSPSTSDFEVLSSANSFVPTFKIHDLEYEDMPDSPAPNCDQRSLSGTQPPVISLKDEQFSKFIAEKEGLETKLEAEMKKNAWVESELAKIKLEKDEMEHNYKLATDNLEYTKKQLQDSEQRAIDLLSQISASLEEKQSEELNLATLLSAKQMVESELENMKASLKVLEQNLSTIEIELQDERKRCKDAETKFQELQQQQLLLGDGIPSTRKENEMPSTHLSANEVKLKKEQEIAAAAEKLAECQQTILVLGKQLKSLGVSKDPGEASSVHMQSTPSLNQVPSTTHRMHELGNQLKWTDESRDARHHMLTEFSEGTSASLDQASNEWDRRLENENGKVSRNSYITGTSDTQPSIEKRGHSGGRYGGLPHYRKIPSEPRGNGLLSPLHSDYDEGIISSSPLEPASSPSRSPARFLSLRNRISGGQDSSKHTSGESDSSSEKHGTGFSRFFSRTRSGN